MREQIIGERIEMWKWETSANNFLLGAQHAQLAEAHVEGRALEGSIGLLHHDHVDSPREGGRVESAVQLLHRHKHRLRQLAHDIHGLGLRAKKEK